MDITFILTIGTPLLIIAAVIKSDRFQEPTALVIKTFFLGVFLCYPAGELNYLFRVMSIHL
jgi:RsiW-degrading membrane proteinase PrsW (M82 family)